MSLLPPIDAHAHIQTGVSARDREQGFEPSSWRSRANARSGSPRCAGHDPLAVWGIGVHPGLPAEVAAFDQAAFGEAVERACFVGEVGLDGKSKADMDAQKRVLAHVLEVVAAHPRPTTLHSVAASGSVLDALRAQPIRAPILHWWRGSQKRHRGSGRARLLLLDQRRRGQATQGAPAAAAGTRAH